MTTSVSPVRPVSVSTTTTSVNGNVPAQWPATATLDSALDDALGSLRALVKAAKLHVDNDAPEHDDESVYRKLGELRTLADDVAQRLQRPSGAVAVAVARTKKFDPLQATAHESERWVASRSQAVAAGSSQPSVWSGFYNKTLRERFDVLALMYPRLNRNSHSKHSRSESDMLVKDAIDPVAKLGELPLRTANLMIENCIGVIGIPLGCVLVLLTDTNGRGTN